MGHSIEARFTYNYGLEEDVPVELSLEDGKVREFPLGDTIASVYHTPYGGKIETFGDRENLDIAVGGKTEVGPNTIVLYGSGRSALRMRNSRTRAQLDIWITSPDQ